MNISSFKTAGGIVGVGVASGVFVWGFLLTLGLNTVLEVTVILDCFVPEVIITGFFLTEGTFRSRNDPIMISLHRLQ